MNNYQKIIFNLETRLDNVEFQKSIWQQNENKDKEHLLKKILDLEIELKELEIEKDKIKNDYENLYFNYNC